MKYLTVFELISDIAKKQGIKCVLIGGFAVNYYKVIRQTADVDFLITEDDFDKIVSLLKNSGYKQDRKQHLFTRFSNNKGVYLMDIDFLFVDEQTIGKIIKDGKKINIAGQKFTIPSLDNLIALKLHSLKHNFKMRENRDLPDIINLIRVNKINCKTKKFQSLCLKYGTKEIYNKILERVK